MEASPTLEAEKPKTEEARLRSKQNLLRLLGSSWLIAFLLTFALYGRSLSFPFFWDDVPNFEFLTTRTFLQIWTNVSGFPHYRPVLFTLWKIGLALFPPAPTFLFHAAVLLTHAVNGGLVGQLARHFSLIRQPDNSSDVASHIKQSEWAGWIATGFFVTYPFGVIAVASNAAFFHPAVTLVTLSAIVGGLKFRQTQRASENLLEAHVRRTAPWQGAVGERFKLRLQQERWFLATLLLTTLAPYVHESGIVAGTLVGLAWIICDRQTRLVRSDTVRSLSSDIKGELTGLNLKHFINSSLWRLSLLALSSLLFVPIWMIVPKSQHPVVWVGWDSIGASLTFFTQGLTYPFQILTRPLLIEHFHLADTTAVWVVALPALVGASAILLRSRAWPLLTFVLSWFGLIILPSAVALNFSYIYAATWLLYSLAPSAAMLWAGVCLALKEQQRQFKWPLVLGMIAWIMLPPLAFIQREVNLAQIALIPVQQLAKIAQQYPHGRYLIINPLDWFASQDTWYPLEHEGIEVMPPYVGLPGLVYTNSGVAAKFEGSVFPPLQTQLDHYLYSLNASGGIQDWASLAALAPTYDRIWLMNYFNDSLFLEEAGGVKNGQARVPRNYRANFEDKVFLTEWDYHAEGNEAVITLNWKYLGPDPEATIFRHVLDCAGNVLGLGDGYALGRMLMFTYLEPGAEIRDVRRIPLEASSTEGCYAVEVGLFRPDGSRVTALAPDGTAFENDVVTLH